MKISRTEILSVERQIDSGSRVVLIERETAVQLMLGVKQLEEILEDRRIQRLLKLYGYKPENKNGMVGTTKSGD
jgi:hypothetical protein